MNDIDDQQLRNLLKADPHMALSKLYDFYYNRLCLIAFRLTRSETVADDIVHQAFMAVWNRRDELSKRHTQPIGKYMATIVDHASRDYHKMQKRQIDIDELLLIRDFPEEDSQHDDIKVEQARAMRKEIANFTLRERQCTLLKIDHGMTPDEIAQVLGVSRKMVEKSHTSVKKKLRAWAAEYRKRYM